MAKIPDITELELDETNRQYWHKALSAIQQNNHGYAIQLIMPVLASFPGFIHGREVLRKCQVYLVGNSKGGTKVFGMQIGGKGKSASASTKKLAKTNPKAALVEIEKELSEDPDSADLNNLLHDCAIQLGMHSTAEFALETIHEVAPKHTKLLHKLADYYIKNQKFTQAAKVYSTISRVDPTDSSAIKGEKDCMAKASMAINTRTAADGSLNIKIKDDAERIALEKKSRAGLTKGQLIERRDDLVRQYQEDQNNLTVVKVLAETYEQLDDFASAYTFFSWAYSISEKDQTLITKASEMKSKADKQVISELEAQLANDPENEELKAQIKELSAASIQERIDEYKFRIEQNPTDTELHYELGRAYFDAEMFGEAIPHLQQAKNNPAIETKVLLLLGQTFDAKGMTDMAIDQLTIANERLLVMDELKKRTLYNLALMYEKLNKQEDYLSALKQIYSADYGFRDVATRVEATY